MNQPAPDFAPHTVIFAQVRECLARTPFEPFRLITTSGKSYEVPTSDHASTLAPLRMIYIARDDGSAVNLNALHVAAIELLAKN